MGIVCGCMIDCFGFVRMQKGLQLFWNVQRRPWENCCVCNYINSVCTISEIWERTEIGTTWRRSDKIASHQRNSINRQGKKNLFLFLCVCFAQVYSDTFYQMPWISMIIKEQMLLSSLLIVHSAVFRFHWIFLLTTMRGTRGGLFQAKFAPACFKWKVFQSTRFTGLIWPYMALKWALRWLNFRLISRTVTSSFRASCCGYFEQLVRLISSSYWDLNPVANGFVSLASICTNWSPEYIRR